MPRRLTAEEADQVSNLARGDGERPQLFIASTGEETEISSDFETYLILTESSIRTQIANFLRVILENDPNNLEVRTELLLLFIREEISNADRAKGEFAEVTEFYDQTRTAFSNTTDGFIDVSEVTLLQEALTSSLGPIAEQRDRLIFNTAALTVLQTRTEAGGSDNFRRELESWVRVLVEYE